MALSLAALSTEYLKYQVTVTLNGAPYDPSADTVQFQFTAVGSTPTGAWLTGSWEKWGGLYFARVLVGPTGGVTTLTAGQYSVWVKITDSPEIPVRLVGTVTVT